MSARATADSGVFNQHTITVTQRGDHGASRLERGLIPPRVTSNAIKQPFRSAPVNVGGVRSNDSRPTVTNWVVEMQTESSRKLDILNDKEDL